MTFTTASAEPEWAPIADLVLPVVKSDPRRTNSAVFRYVDIGSVNSEQKQIEQVQEVLAADAPSRARQVLQESDVLVSTVRPNLNAVAVVGEIETLTIGSTGFCVLRPDPTRLSARYLFHWVRTPHFVATLVRQATGASYPAVSDRIVKASTVPLPPLDEQRRIAAVLDAADQLRYMRRRALARFDTLTQSIFIDMFGDPAREWPASSIAAVVADEKGSIRTGPFGSQLLHEEFVDEGIAVLGIDNAVQNRFTWGERRFITPEKFERLRKYQVYPGDVLVTIMATCGRTAIVPDDIGVAINTKHLCCITVDRDRCLPEYLWGCLRFHPRVLSQLGATHGAVMPGLNMGLIKAAEIPLPPLELQHQFAARKAAVEATSSTAQASDHELARLFTSLQQRAFRGEL